jgi:hypothetical protein
MISILSVTPLRSASPMMLLPRSIARSEGKILKKVPAWKDSSRFPARPRSVSRFRSGVDGVISMAAISLREASRLTIDGGRDVGDS